MTTVGTTNCSIFVLQPHVSTLKDNHRTNIQRHLKRKSGIALDTMRYHFHN